MSSGFNNPDFSQDQGGPLEVRNGPAWNQHTAEYLLTKKVQQLVSKPDTVRTIDILGRGAVVDITI